MTATLPLDGPARLTSEERIVELVDAGSFQPLRSAVRSTRLGARAAGGDGVVGGLAEIDGRPVVCYSQDRTLAGGSLGGAQAQTIVRLLGLAGDSGIPVVAVIESAGARLQEGLEALAGYGAIFRDSVRLSGRVPQISIVCGAAAGGGSYAPALTDFVVMTEQARMFLTGPGVVRDALGEDVSAEELGGPRIHGRNGVAQLVACDDVSALADARRLLGYLPDNSSGPVPRRLGANGPAGTPDEDVPASPRAVYDSRDVIRRLADGGDFLEISAQWARNVVCGFGRLEGHAVGVVANQPRHLAGVLDDQASQKAARFVRTCNLFGIPLLVLVDTPGFMPGRRQEKAGVIRHGAKLVHAFAEATVPRVTVILRKAYGGACITMNSKALGADLVFAWPGAEIGVMAASQAVGIVKRRELTGAREGERERAAADYAREHLSASAAAASGFVDELIEPVETRGRVIGALAALKGKRRGPIGGNIPL
jgi:acetyl-CoA carboxylase carboxyltransferase component